MNRDKLFYWTCLSFAGGVALRSFWQIDSRLPVLAGAAAIILISFFSLISKRKLIVAISIFALAFSIGILRFHLADKPAPVIFENQAGQKISLSGIILDEPEKGENNVKFTVEAEKDGAKTKILLFTEKNEGYKYGDELTFTGKLEKPGNFLTDNAKEFDYPSYLRKDGVFYIIRYPKIYILSRNNGNFIKTALFAAKEKFAAAIDSSMPAPETDLMKGLVLGERSSFSQELRQAFINTGTIHIVTVSGYNVTLVSGWIMKIFGFLPMVFSIGAGILSVFLYVIATGGAQTAIRAGIMAAIALFARGAERLYDASRALALAGVVMVFINPFILVFDVSFELSFLATIAVIFLSPKIERYFLWIKWKGLRDIFSVTLAAYIFVLPFILYKMGGLSVVALPANVAILPLIPATMILGFVTGFAGLVFNALAWLPGKIAYLLLDYELGAINFFSNFSFSSLSVPNFPFWLMIFIYAIFFRVLFGKSAANVQSRRFLILLAPFFITLVAAGFLSYRHYAANQTAELNLRALLSDASAEKPASIFKPDPRTKTSGCKLRGPLPDHECTPGAIFENTALEQICVRGYTKTVRSVSTKLRKAVYAEYGIVYPQPRGAYEADHLIPLAIGGSNDIANLFPEAAKPAPGFREKDLVEVYLQEQVCSRNVPLAAAQRQVAADWTAIYNNLSPEEILRLKKKYKQD